MVDQGTEQTLNTGLLAVDVQQADVDGYDVNDDILGKLYDDAIGGEDVDKDASIDEDDAINT